MMAGSRAGGLLGASWSPNRLMDGHGPSAAWREGDGDVLFDAIAGLPDHHHQPGRAQRQPDVGERSGRVAEEDRAEPAERPVEALPWKALDLRVGALEGGVARPLR